MRVNPVSPSSAHLSYAIRDIVKFGEIVRQHGVDITWENIGDPIAKGEAVAPWIREIVHDVVDMDSSWGYCPTEGFLEVRRALAAHVNDRPGARVSADDIIFFNGVADAVSKVYGFLSPKARVIGPSPAYSTHSSAESAHCSLPHIMYDLDPDNGWMPDMVDLRDKVQADPSIAGILIINPNNPTGAVYPVRVLKEIVALAREFGLFLVADEIYIHMVFPGVDSALAGIALRMDRGPQPCAGPELRHLCGFPGGRQAARSVFHERAATSYTADLWRPSLPRSSNRARRDLLRSGEGGPADTWHGSRGEGQSGPGRLLHDRPL
jgi:alanine-synthesizing transaminase